MISGDRIRRRLGDRIWIKPCLRYEEDHWYSYESGDLASRGADEVRIGAAVRTTRVLDELTQLAQTDTDDDRFRDFEDETALDIDTPPQVGPDQNRHC